MEQIIADDLRKDSISRFKLLRFFSWSLILTGLITSGYLFYRHNVLTAIIESEKIDVCSALFGKGCDNALKSSASSLWGLSLAGWGIIYYITLSLLLILHQFLN